MISLIYKTDRFFVLENNLPGAWGAGEAVCSTWSLFGYALTTCDVKIQQQIMSMKPSE